MTPKVRVSPKAAPRAIAKPSGAAHLPVSKGLGVNWREFAIPIAVLGIVFAMITPLPSFLLDILISANITFSVIVL